MTRDERHDEYLESGDPTAAPVDDDERAALDELRAMLAEPAVWAEPDDEALDRLLIAIDEERPAEEVRSVQPAPRRGSVTLGRRRRRWYTAGIAAAAAVALLFVALSRRPSDTPAPPAIEIAMAAPAGGEATGLAKVRDAGGGTAIALDISGLPPAPAGTYYSAWVVGDAGRVPAGSFHLRDGESTIYLWAGVGIDDYPTISVTIQHEGESEQSSGEVQIAGTLDG